VTESGSGIQRGMGITSAAWPSFARRLPPGTAAHPRSVARTASCNSSAFRDLSCGNDTSPRISYARDQIQSMWTESMWSKWNPNWSLYLSKPLFSG